MTAQLGENRVPLQRNHMLPKEAHQPILPTFYNCKLLTHWYALENTDLGTERREPSINQLRTASMVYHSPIYCSWDNPSPSWFAHRRLLRMEASNILARSKASHLQADKQVAKLFWKQCLRFRCQSSRLINLVNTVNKIKWLAKIQGVCHGMSPKGPKQDHL
jgi:hypothetical protein